MLSLKSKKISLGVLVALLSLDWFVGSQAPDSGSSSNADSFNSNLSMPHLPTLRIVPQSPAFTSGKLFNFSDAGNNASHLQELQALTFTTPLQIGLAQLSKREPAQQFMETAQVNVNDQIIREAPALSPITAADDKEASANMTPPPPAAPAKTKAGTLQADNLIKLLALYSMLHR
jgi:hypothetical protein